MSEDEAGQLDEGEDPDPEEVGQPDLYQHPRTWTYPGDPIHFSTPDGR